MTMIERICRWCNTHLGWVEGTPNQAGQVTHGMCDACRDKWQKDLEALKQGKGGQP